jgi:hypothetical protein
MQYSHKHRPLFILAACSVSFIATIASAEVPVVPVPELPKFDVSDPVKYGTALAAYTELYDVGWKDAYAKARLTLIDHSGDKVQREVRTRTLEGDHGDKSMLRFISPAEVRGVTALTHEKPDGVDDSWLYLPASRRVRRVSGANRRASFQGTEFTYEDLSSLIAARYDWKFLRDEGDLHVLEAKPRDPDSGYTRIVIWLHGKHFRTEKTEFYDLAGKHLKTLTLSKWKHLHKRYWRPMQLSMVNHQTLKRTVIENRSQFLDMSRYKKKDGSPRKNLQESAFTRRALEKS